MMAGMLIFRSLPEAIRAGYQVYDRMKDGYLVRQRLGDTWHLAIVSFGDGTPLPDQVDRNQLDRPAPPKPLP